MLRRRDAILGGRRAHSSPVRSLVRTSTCWQIRNCHTRRSWRCMQMASTATAPAPAGSTADVQAKGDVLVIFGITGDLAKVMTFESLYKLEARGLLDVPIVGVAVDDWTVDDLKKRARDSIEGAGET